MNPLTTGRRRSRRNILVLACALALGMLAFGDGVATAQDDPDIDLAVELGFDGIGEAQGWLPLSIRLEGRRPISGRLDITVEDRQPSFGTSLAVELSAGTPARYDLVVPGGQVQVRLLDGDDLVESARVTSSIDHDRFITGVLDRVTDGLPRVDILPARRAAHWVTVEPGWLTVPQALSSLDSLVVTAAQAREMTVDEDVWRTIRGEVARGMTLVVTGGLGDGLPMELDGMDPNAPAADTRVVEAPDGVTAPPEPGDDLSVDATVPFAIVRGHGTGRLIVAEDPPWTRPDGQLWASLVGPRGTLSLLNDQDANANNPFLVTEMFREAGRGPTGTGIPFFALFALGYVILVGPVNALVLRRMGRRELAWLTVPAISLLCSGIAVGVAGTDDEADPLVRTLTWWVEDDARQELATAWVSPSGGVDELELEGDGWRAMPWGIQIDSANVVHREGGVTVRTEALRGSVSGVLASRDLRAAPPFVVSAQTHEGGVEITVNNTSDDPLRNATIYLGNVAVETGLSLQPDETFSMTYPGALGPQSAFNIGRPFDLFPHEFGPVTALPDDEFFVDAGGGFGPGVFGSQVSVGSGLVPAALRIGQPGLVWVAASQVGPAAGAVELGGTPAEVLNQDVAVATRVRSDATELTPHAALTAQVVHRDERNDPIAATGFGEAIVRLQLPPYQPGSELFGPVRTASGVRVISVWDATAAAWRDVDTDTLRLDPAPLQTASGEIYLRVQGPVDGVGLTLGPPGTTEEDVPQPVEVANPFGPGLTPTPFATDGMIRGDFTEIPIPPVQVEPIPPVQVEPLPSPGAS